MERAGTRAGTQRRYLALWFPFLASERLLRKASAGPGDKPLVLVEKDRGALRLSDCDARAVALGLTRGLTLADARARIPELMVVEADPAADLRFLDQLAAFCDRYTPLVAFDPPHGLVLDITGCAHLFGGEGEMRHALGARMRRLGLSLRASIAGTPEAARALARFGDCALAPPGADEAAVRPLPVAALEASPETVIALSRAGLKTLGDLADRPSQALSARFGEALATRLRRMLGREDARITPLRPPPDCVVERHFPDPLQDIDGLEAILARLLGEAARMLEARGEGGRAFEISFFRSDGAVRRLALETGRPSRDPAAILRLYRERIDALADPLDPGFGFDAIRLAVPICEPLGTPQLKAFSSEVGTGSREENASRITSLDGRAVEDGAVAELVDRLVARFGRERVLRFVARDSHHPEREALAAPAAAAMPAELPAWPDPAPDEPPLRPLQLFEPPQPVETLAEVPDGPPLRFRWRRVLHEIARAEGPERIAPEWWRDRRTLSVRPETAGRQEFAPNEEVGHGHDRKSGPHFCGPCPDEPTRDYYRVEDAAGHRFWLFRAGLYGRETTEPRWYLHGLFA
jgi:protein ImuB